MKPEKKSILPGLSNISNTKKPLESLLKVKDDMSSSVLPIMAEFLKVKPYRRVIKQDGTIRQEVKPPSVKAREILKPGFSGNMFASYYVANKTFGWWDGSQTGLLDDYPSASAAYSVRALNSAYTGALLRVRRSSDNAEQDIHAIANGDFDTTSLLSFVGAANGFVVTWYDQSGNSENITQTLASSQPKIINAGSLVLSNSKVAIELGGTSTTSLIKILSTPITQPSTYLRVFENNGAIGSQRHFVEINDPSYVIGQTVSNVVTQYAGAFLSGTTTIINDSQYLHSGLFNTTSSQIRLNGASENTGNNGGLTSVTNLYIGGNTISNLFIGKAQEYIIYNSNNSTDLPAIESNINSYYSIYWDGSQTGLLDDYPSASAAYSVRALNSTYTGPLMRVRRSSDNAEQDIYAKYDGNLDTTSLLSFVGAANGFVVTWYDQSGNGDNATSAIAAEQPRIVVSGTLQTENSKPVIIGNTGTIRFNTSVDLSSTSPTQFSVSRHEGVVNAIGYALSNFTDSGGNTNRTQLLSINGSAASPYLTAPTSSFLNGSSFAFTTRDVAYDNLITQSLVCLKWTNPSFINLNYIGTSYTTFSMMSTQEFILYDADKLSDRADIESNINTYYSIYWDGSQTSLLDDYPSASAAYSVRALNSAYTGALLRVRRSSDNAEQDIYAKYDGNLDTESLLTFVGAGDGFVVTWYDQSGNGLNATNSTAANQPQIVASGVLITDGSQPSLYFDGNNDQLNAPVVFSGTELSQIFVTNIANTQSKNSAHLINGNTVNYTNRLAVINSSILSWYSAGAGSSQVVIQSQYSYRGTQSLISIYAQNGDGYNVSAYKNLDPVVNLNNPNYSIGSHTSITIGNWSVSGGEFTGKMSELIYYPINKESDQIGLRSNINSHYSIF